MTWVLATDNIEIIEKHFGRSAAEGKRQKPDGTVLEWKQIGVKDILQNSQLPFYVEWISKIHPSNDGVSLAKLSEIIIFGDRNSVLANLIETDKLKSQEVKLNFSETEANFSGIKEIVFEVKGQQVVID
jgi:hypothetical protein